MSYSQLRSVKYYLKLNCIWASVSPHFCFQFMVSHPMQDKFNVDKMIDISPHAPYGSKQARNAAKERAAQRYNLVFNGNERLHFDCDCSLRYLLLFYINDTVEMHRTRIIGTSKTKMQTLNLSKHLVNFGHAYIYVLPNIYISSKRLYYSVKIFNSFLSLLTSLPLFPTQPHLKRND